MCGITGYFRSSRDWGAEELRSTVRRMSDALFHRGPDDSGEWVDPSVGLALGFRRLSIIDLTPAGRQPMHSSSGRFVIVYNGEVYNFEAIRSELVRDGYSEGFRGHSDTEVMLAGIERWGLQRAVQKFIGMFAIALFDRKERLLHLVRDRVGVKPLYYGWCGSSFVFGSELKPFRQHPDFRPELNRDAIALFLRHDYIPAPHTVYRGIHKLPPGSILTLGVDSHPALHQIESYWKAAEVAESGDARRSHRSEAEAIEELEALLLDSVRLRMIADVPLGVFLSGGVDSSTVVALMQCQSSVPVRTFTIGFHDKDYDEARYAKAVAEHLGTAHTELYVTAEEAMRVIPRLPAIYDEPFADSSQIPTSLVSRLARQQVTVSLSGDGGDELFGGYNRYVWARRIWKGFGWLPEQARRSMASVIRKVSPGIGSRIGRGLPAVLRVQDAADKLQKASDILCVSSPEAMYRLLVSHWLDPSQVVINSREAPTVLTDRNGWPNLDDFVLWMMYLDLVSYLPDDILVKVDRASMAVSLEAREPLLDHRVVEFAWRLPLQWRVRRGVGKWLLRRVLQKHVPSRLIERPKMGFGIPIGAWLRGPLRDWAEALLDAKRLDREGVLSSAPIRQCWSEHLAGQRNWHYQLWNVLMFQAWYEHQRNLTAAEPLAPAFQPAGVAL